MKKAILFVMRRVIMKRKILTLSLFLLIAAYSSVVSALNVPIDLTDFYADPTVTVSSDGSSAIIAEDPSLSTVLLSNDPYYGDPGIVVPDGLITLNFSYNFVEPTNNDDEFYAKVFDGDSGALLDEFSIDYSDSGTVSWDLSGIDPAITLLGLEFQLNAYDLEADSYVEISNVYMETAVAPVPEPGTFVLIGSGILGFLSFSRKKSRKIQGNLSAPKQ